MKFVSLFPFKNYFNVLDMENTPYEMYLMKSFKETLRWR